MTHNHNNISVWTTAQWKNILSCENNYLKNLSSVFTPDGWLQGRAEECLRFLNLSTKYRPCWLLVRNTKKTRYWHWPFPQTLTVVSPAVFCSWRTPRFLTHISWLQCLQWLRRQWKIFFCSNQTKFMFHHLFFSDVTAVTSACTKMLQISELLYADDHRVYLRHNHFWLNK